MGGTLGCIGAGESPVDLVMRAAESGRPKEGVKIEVVSGTDVDGVAGNMCDGREKGAGREVRDLGGPSPN